MAQVTIEEIEAAIKNQELAREQALAQANFHAGCLGAWKELLAKLKEPEEITAPVIEAPARSAATVLEMPDAAKSAKAAQGKGNGVEKSARV